MSGRPIPVLMTLGLVRGLVGGLVPALLAIGALRVAGAAVPVAAVVGLGLAFASALLAIGDLLGESRPGIDRAHPAFLFGAAAVPVGFVPWLSPLGYHAGLRALEAPSVFELVLTFLLVFPGLLLGLARAVSLRLVRTTGVAAIFKRAAISATVVSSVLGGCHAFVWLLAVTAPKGSIDIAPASETLRSVAVIWGAFIAIACGHAAARPVEHAAARALEPEG